MAGAFHHSNLVDKEQELYATLTEVSGKVGLDVNLIGGQISISGITISGVTADQGAPGSSPWPVEFLTPQDVIVSGPVTVTGSVDVVTFPSSMEVTQGTNPWGVSGNVSASQQGDWTVLQGNAPWGVSGDLGRTWALSGTTDEVSISGTVPISGSVSINNFPTTQGVSGTVSGAVDAWAFDGSGNAIQSTGGALHVALAFPTTVTANQGTNPWNVNVSGTAAVSGTVSVSGLAINKDLSQDDLTATSTAVVGGFLYGWQESASNWDKWRMIGDNADNIGVAGTGHMQVMSHGMVYNGTSWDRSRGDITNGLDVDVTRVQGTVAVSGTVNAVVSGTATVSGTVAVTQSTDPWSINQKLFVPSAPATATVGIANTSVATANGSRKKIVVQNLSANTVSLGFDNNAVLNSGVTLYPGGTCVEYVSGAVSGIASAASSVVSVQEYT